MRPLNFGERPRTSLEERHGRKSTLVTSNLDTPERIDAVPNQVLGGAAIDRLRHGTYTLLLEGKSYRSPRTINVQTKIPPQKSSENDTMKGGEK